MIRKRKHGLSYESAAASTLQKRHKIHHVDSPSTQHSVLCQYYPKVQTLQDYLLAELPASSKSRRRRIVSICRNAEDQELKGGNNNCRKSIIDIDWELARLLNSTLLGAGSMHGARQLWTKDFEIFSQQLASTAASSWAEGTTSQPEVVDFAVWLLFNRLHRASHRPLHLLCHGFQRAGSPHEVGQDHCAASGIPGLVSLYPNDHVTTIKGALWSRLLEILGQDGEHIMLDLILGCGIYVALKSGKDNYYQLSGTPLSELPTLEVKHTYPHVVAATDPGPRCKGLHRAQKLLQTPSDISFIRSRMMHARSALNAKGEVQFGLRHIHVFNRFPDHQNPRHTIHIMKYIFPRQFGLHNVFTCSVDSRETSHTLKDYTLREGEIALSHHGCGMSSSNKSRTSNRSLPRRLRGSLVALIATMQKLHTKCSYLELLKHYCPVDLIDGRGKRRHGKRRHRRKGTNPHPNRGVGINMNTLQIDYGAPRRCLTDAATPSEQVSAFCRAALLKVVPNGLWGVGNDGQKNRENVMRHVDQFIHLRRFESSTLHSVCQHMKLQCIKWLVPPKMDHTLSLSKSDAEKRREILLEFLYYVFDSILIPLIRSNFHVTQSSAHGNKLFFFRHDLWRLVTEPAITSMKLSMFAEIPSQKAKRLLDTRVLGFSQIRLLPKASGLRPIMNLRRRVTKLHGGKAVLGRSINSVMAPVFNMLSYEKSAQPDRLQSALFSVGDIYPRLKTFRDQLESSNRWNEKLYFVKVDVQSCFDTIPQRRVVKLIEQLCSEAEYRVARHVEIKPNESHGYQADSGVVYKPARKFVAKARPAQEFSRFEEVLDVEARGKRCTIFIDSVVQASHDKEQLLDLLEEHVERNMIKIGKKFFRQKQGIPQGSVLSSLLCNFCYADFEREHLGFLDGTDSLLLRLIDDFLLITTSKSHATRFLQAMYDGNDDYGIKVRAEKSLINFSTSPGDAHAPRLGPGTAFPYCGITIDTKTLHISKDRCKRMDTVISDSLTVETSNVPGKTFHRKSMNTFKIQTHAMLLDTSLNTLATVLSTIYQNLLESAMKFYRYAKSMGSRRRPPASLLTRTIHDLSDLAYVLIQSKHESHKFVQYKCGVTKAQIEWLTSTAFRHVLHAKQSSYREVLEWLDGRIETMSLGDRRQMVMLRRTARQGNAVFAGYRY